MTAPKWTRPTPGPTARIFHQARQALSDAQHAGDATLAALILHDAARRVTAQAWFWNRVRPPLGVRRSTATTLPSGQRKEAA